MVTVKIRHLRERASGYYFQPSAVMRKAGFYPEPLGKQMATAIQRVHELNMEWDRVRAAPPPSTSSATGSIAWLIGEFTRSDWYRVLKPATKSETDYHLKIIAAAFGRVQVRSIKRRHCRDFHNKLVEAKSRPYANKSIKWLRRLINYAVELDICQTNPALRMGLKQNPPRHEVWTPKEIDAFKTAAEKEGRRSWSLGVQLGYDTSQRLSDILALTWNDFDGEGLTFRQAKTGAQVWVSLSPESLRMLKETERRAVQIIVGDCQGKPISHNSFFGRIFREIRSKADMRQDLQFHDLRRTAATEISSGGGNIEHITGHRPGSSAIKHYVVPNKDAAREAQRARHVGQKREQKLEK